MPIFTYALDAASEPGAATKFKHWLAKRKKKVVPHGESVHALLRELIVERNRSEEWRDRVLAGLDSGFKEREGWG